jgi:hypothetical protein
MVNGVGHGGKRDRESSYSAMLRQKFGFKLLELLWFISAAIEAFIYRQITSLCSRWLILSESH